MEKGDKQYTSDYIILMNEDKLIEEVNWNDLRALDLFHNKLSDARKFIQSNPELLKDKFRNLILCKRATTITAMDIYDLKEKPQLVKR